MERWTDLVRMGDGGGLAYLDTAPDGGANRHFNSFCRHTYTTDHHHHHLHHTKGIGLAITSCRTLDTQIPVDSDTNSCATVGLFVSLPR